MGGAISPAAQLRKSLRWRCVKGREHGCARAAVAAAGDANWVPHRRPGVSSSAARPVGHEPKPQEEIEVDCAPRLGPGGGPESSPEIPHDLWSPEPAGPARHGAMAKGREPEDDTFLHWGAASGYREIIGGLPPSKITLGKLAQTRDHTAAGHRCTARPATIISTS